MRPLLRRLLRPLRLAAGRPLSPGALDELLHIGEIAVWEACLRWEARRGPYARFASRLAYRRMRNALLADMRQEEVSLESLENFPITYEVEGSREPTPYDWAIQEVPAVLSAGQLAVFRLWREGYRAARIAELLSVSRQYVSAAQAAIRKKVEKLMLKEVVG